MLRKRDFEDNFAFMFTRLNAKLIINFLSKAHWWGWWAPYVDVSIWAHSPPPLSIFTTQSYYHSILLCNFTDEMRLSRGMTRQAASQGSPWLVPFGQKIGHRRPYQLQWRSHRQYQQMRLPSLLGWELYLRQATCPSWQGPCRDLSKLFQTCA